jgi:hypothetical protein
MLAIPLLTVTGNSTKTGYIGLWYEAQGVGGPPMIEKSANLLAEVQSSLIRPNRGPVNATLYRSVWVIDAFASALGIELPTDAERENPLPLIKALAEARLDWQDAETTSVFEQIIPNSWVCTETVEIVAEMAGRASAKARTSLTGFIIVGLIHHLGAVPKALCAGAASMAHPPRIILG